MLSGPSVSPAARKQAADEAQTTGKSPTKTRTRAIIAEHKPPPALPPRTLTLNETIAVVWRAIRNHTTTEPAARLAWLNNATPAVFLAVLNTGVTLDEPLLTAARKRVEAELRGQIHHAQQKEERRTPQQGKPTPIPSAASELSSTRLRELLLIWETANDTLDELDSSLKRFTPFVVREWISRTIQVLQENSQ
jgi:hypothetical protein